jgi:hypothetical protein
VPADYRPQLLGFVALLEHATLESIPPHLLAVSVEIHDIVEALLYASVRQTIERRCREVELARKIERCATAARWAYMAIVGGVHRGDADEADRIANVAMGELITGDEVEESMSACLLPFMIGWHRAWSVLAKRCGDVAVADADGERWQYMGTSDGRHFFRHRGRARGEFVATLPGDHDYLCGSRYVHVQDPSTLREVLSVNPVNDVATISHGPAVGRVNDTGSIHVAYLLDPECGWTRLEAS